MESKDWRVDPIKEIIMVKNEKKTSSSTRPLRFPSALRSAFNGNSSFCRWRLGIRSAPSSTHCTRKPHELRGCPEKQPSCGEGREVEGWSTGAVAAAGLQPQQAKLFSVVWASRSISVVILRPGRDRCVPVCATENMKENFLVRRNPATARARRAP